MVCASEGYTCGCRLSHAQGFQFWYFTFFPWAIDKYLRELQLWLLTLELDSPNIKRRNGKVVIPLPKNWVQPPRPSVILSSAARDCTVYVRRPISSTSFLISLQVKKWKGPIALLAILSHLKLWVMLRMAVSWPAWLNG